MGCGYVRRSSPGVRFGGVGKGVCAGKRGEMNGVGGLLPVAVVAGSPGFVDAWRPVCAVAAEVEDVADLVTVASAVRPVLVVVDTVGRVEDARSACARLDRPVVVVAEAKSTRVGRFAAVGVSGFVAPVEVGDVGVLSRVVERVVSGRRWFSPVMLAPAAHATASRRPGGPVLVGACLTARERDVLAVLADPVVSQVEAAARLCVSPHTVRTVTKRLRERFGVSTTRAVVVAVEAAGLL